MTHLLSFNVFELIRQLIKQNKESENFRSKSRMEYEKLNPLALQPLMDKFGVDSLDELCESIIPQCVVTVADTKQLHDPRIMKELSRAAKPFDVHKVEWNTEHGQCQFAYAFMEQKMTWAGITEDAKKVINGMAGTTMNGILSILHLTYLTKHVRSIVDHGHVTKFMLGKSSGKRDKHIYHGMMNRYSNKYSATHIKGGSHYTHMIGLMFLDGTEYANGEQLCVDLEKALRNILEPTYRNKFDSDLSNWQHR